MQLTPCQDKQKTDSREPARGFAAIDVGSNSVRLLLSPNGKRLSATTRLAQGLASSGRLSQGSMHASAEAIADFARIARENGRIPLAYATSAVRDAGNREEFLALVQKACGILIDVLSGEREAGYAYAAASLGGGLIDIGGGSMQLVSENARLQKSFPLGCVRARELALQCVPSAESNEDAQFPALRSAVLSRLNELLSPCLSELKELHFSPCVGVGGSITTLAALGVRLTAKSKRALDGSELTRSRLERLIGELNALGSGRRELPLLVKRHDVILYGAVLLAGAMDALKLDSITSSIRDGLDGYLEAAEKHF